MPPKKSPKKPKKDDKKSKSATKQLNHAEKAKLQMKAARKSGKLYDPQAKKSKRAATSQAASPGNPSAAAAAAAATAARATQVSQPLPQPSAMPTFVGPANWIGPRDDRIERKVRKFRTQTERKIEQANLLLKRVSQGRQARRGVNQRDFLLLRAARHHATKAYRKMPELNEALVHYRHNRTMRNIRDARTMRAANQQNASQ